MHERQVGHLRFVLNLSEPLYEQVMEQMRSFIARGELELGAKIPSVREMARELKINPNTVMRAYQELERDGITEQRRGQGTFITSSQEQIDGFRMEVVEKEIQIFMLKMQSLGLSPKDILSHIDNYRTDDKKGSEPD